MEHSLAKLNIPFLLRQWDNFIPLTALLILYFVALGAVIHILLIKRDPRSALGWIVVCLGFPGIGVLFYILFGINRIRTRAKDWQGQGKWGVPPKIAKATQALSDLGDKNRFDSAVYNALMHVSHSVTRHPLVAGCDIKTYYCGADAYTAMLSAIAGAQKSICFCTYIFANGKIGRVFADALAAAKARGVSVRIIVDGVGILYSFPTLYHHLKKLGLNVVKFLPPSFSKRSSIHLNLRNHRKILVIDSQTAFTGGMNISDQYHRPAASQKDSALDLHFRVTGPVVEQLEITFFEDWHFITGERLETGALPAATSGTALCRGPQLASGGTALCRGVSAGPNEDFEKLRWIVNGAFASAQKNIRIMTPYFIPDASMHSAITTARLKGVKVEIILPEKNNLPYVGWAIQAHLEEFLSYGVDIYYRPAPFAHSKLLIVDDFFALVGSANLDPRSLRLNFEFNLEVYDKDFAHELSMHFEDVKKVSRQLTHAAMRQRPLFIKLRDASAKLFSPYL